MNVKILLGAACLVSMLVSFTSVVQAADKRTLISDLVFELGYGRAVHNFKDYLIRGDEEYRIKARDYFESAKAKIDALQALNNLSDKEQQALASLEHVINSYVDALPTIQRAYKHSHGLAQVLTRTEERVRINDRQAIDSIAILREGYRWSRVEKLVFALGYGSAIYNFKNYLIRRDDKYKEWADSWFDEALDIVAQMRWLQRDNATKVAALNDVKAVLEAYRSALPVMERTLEPAKETSSNIVINVAVRGADKALKVEDQPAVNALMLLLAKN